MKFDKIMEWYCIHENCQFSEYFFYSIYYMASPQGGKMNQIPHCDWLPEQPRWSYLAHSGLSVMSHKKNFPKSHIVDPLLT